MWRVQEIVHRMGHTLTVAAEMLEAVLDAMDAEMSELEHRLATDAAQLREAVEASQIGVEQRHLLLVATKRIEQTAAQVASFAHRPSDAKAQIDALLAEGESSAPPAPTTTP